MAPKRPQKKFIYYCKDSIRVRLSDMDVEDKFHFYPCCRLYFLFLFYFDMRCLDKLAKKRIQILPDCKRRVAYIHTTGWREYILSIPVQHDIPERSRPDTYVYLYLYVYVLGAHA